MVDTHMANVYDSITVAAAVLPNRRMRAAHILCLTGEKSQNVGLFLQVTIRQMYKLALQCDGNIRLNELARLSLKLK